MKLKTLTRQQSNSSFEGRTAFRYLTGVGLSVLLVGCGSSILPAPSSDATGVNKAPKFQGPPTDAGVEVKQNTDPKPFQKLVVDNATKWRAKGDPFALQPGEKAFDIEQASERAFSGLGGFTTEVEPKSEVAPVLYVEPQPYRRLSGIVVGESIVAILDLGGSNDPVLIHPGMKIPNSPWTVLSIDEDKAVLTRGGDVLPHEIVVRLETPPPGFDPATGAGTRGQGSGFQGGFPGGPGGFPGGPGGRFGTRPGGRGGK